MERIKQLFEQHKNKRSDINEHLQTLYELGLECDHITEMGVRKIVSTYAFLLANPKNGVISIDLYHPSTYGGKLDIVARLASDYGIDFKFIKGSTLEIEIDQTDLLFIDTLHTYDQLIQELNLHSEKVSKYIALHDTTLFAHKPEKASYAKTIPTQGRGLWDAVEEFLSQNKQWEVKHRYTHNNGLTVLQRVWM